MSIHQRFYNDPPPQTITGPAVSAPLKRGSIYVQVTADCFICISADGTGVDGAAVSATNGHFMPAGSFMPFAGINPTFKLGVNIGTVYISAWG